jgi:hypothetical protein
LIRPTEDLIQTGDMRTKKIHLSQKPCSIKISITLIAALIFTFNATASQYQQIGSLPSGGAYTDLCFANRPDGPTEQEIKDYFIPSEEYDIIVEKTENATGNDSEWSVTYTYVIKECNSDADPQCNPITTHIITYTGKDSSAPFLDPNATPYTGQSNLNACYETAESVSSFNPTAALQGYMDNCSQPVIEYIDKVKTGTNSSWTITYNYKIKDNAGNSILASYSDTGKDQSAPYINGTTYAGQSDLNACFATAESVSRFNKTLAIQGYMDNCGTVTAVLTDSIKTGDNNEWRIAYNYLVKDMAGNTIAASYSNTGKDRTAPSLTGTKFAGEKNVSALKDDAISAAAFDAAKALQGYTDNCNGVVTAILTETILTGTDCSWTLQYKYSVLDAYGNVLANQSYTNTGGILSVVSVSGPADFPTHACKYTSTEAYNTAFNNWKAQFKVVDEGYGGTATDISGINPPLLCGGGSVTINYNYSDGCSSASVSATFTITPCYSTVKPGDWNDATVWQNGCVPSHTGGLPNKTVININHNLNLIDYCYTGKKDEIICVEGSFKSVQGTNFLDIYVNDGATWFIQGDVEILRNMSLYIEYNSNIQIGSPPPACYTSFCEPLPAGCIYKKSKFSVYGSAQGSTDNPPGIYIREQGAFHLYGDIYVENNFDIIVAPGGEFIVEGGFVAGNKAEVAFYGEDDSESIGSIGCDMDFTNSGTIYMVGATLDVGGDLTFGNSSDIYLVGSTINVLGEICSGEGSGEGAVITIHNGYWDGTNYIPVTDDTESGVNAGYFCAAVKNPDNIPLPVELLYFQSTANKNNIQLEWSTASELYNDYFTIERSTNLSIWETAGYVTGAGTANERNTYTFTDHHPLKGISYYRLKQTDFDGMSEYFQPVAVNFEPTSVLDFILLKHGNQWSVEVPGHDSFILEVYSLTGHKIYSAEGIYFIRFPNPAATVVIKVISGTRRVSRVVM